MKITHFIIAILISVTSFAQTKQYKRSNEIGFGIGAVNYTGDLSERFNVKFTGPSAQAFYRYNFSNEVSVLRVNLFGARLDVEEARTNRPLRVARDLSFSGTILEVSVLYEYDFFDFRDIDNRYFMSPYLFGGIGGASIIGDNSVAFANIPFGVGVKYRLTGGWNLGLEFGARKNFTDRLDGVDDEAILNSGIGTDWYYHSALTLSYTFYDLICPEDTKSH